MSDFAKDLGLTAIEDVGRTAQEAGGAAGGAKGAGGEGEDVGARRGPPEAPIRLAEQVEQAGGVQEPQPKSFLEGRGAWMMITALAFVGAVSILTISTWAMTRPTLDSLTKAWVTSPMTLEEAQAILGKDAKPEQVAGLQDRWAKATRVETPKVVESFGTLVKIHNDGFRDMFQLVVLSALVPIFTLLAGYVFGKRDSSPGGA